MSDFHVGLLIGALAGFVVGGVTSFVLYGRWVPRLLRQLTSDTRQLLERT